MEINSKIEFQSCTMGYYWIVVYDDCNWLNKFHIHIKHSKPLLKCVLAVNFDLSTQAHLAGQTSWNPRRQLDQILLMNQDFTWLFLRIKKSLGITPDTANVWFHPQAILVILGRLIFSSLVTSSVESWLWPNWPLLFHPHESTSPSSARISRLAL